MVTLVAYDEKLPNIKIIIIINEIRKPQARTSFDIIYRDYRHLEDTRQSIVTSDEIKGVGV